MDERTDETIAHGNDRADEMAEDENISEEPAAFVAQPPDLAGIYGAPSAKMDAAPSVRVEEPGTRSSGLNRQPDNLNKTAASIEETRTELEDTIVAIKEKLNPAHLATQVRETIRDTVVERAGQKIGSVKDMVKEAANRTVDVAKQLLDRPSAAALASQQNAVEPIGPRTDRIGGATRGAGVLNAMRQNPLPMAVMGIGALWLIVSAGRSDAISFSDECEPFGGNGMESGEQIPTDKIRGTDGDMTGTIKEMVNRFGAKTQDFAVRTKLGVARTMDERPLAAGAAALLLGMAAGMIVPETTREIELMGQARDRLASRAERSMKVAISAKVDEVAEKLAIRVESATHELLGT